MGALPRRHGEIGIHSVRGGGNVGEHDVIMSDTDEQVTITHRAFSRAAYARGALNAVTFLAERKPGFYTMTDLVTQATTNRSQRSDTN